MMRPSFLVTLMLGIAEVRGQAAVFSVGCALLHGGEGALKLRGCCRWWRLLLVRRWWCVWCQVETTKQRVRPAAVKCKM